ncbi:/ ribF / Riboflavin biosynthesis protein ribF /:186551 Forward [Candidatus Hepatoplasma crinochetorum]|uniref:Riboflavin biosynthesis protein n=1 Tax=Candidatus Hepatoplasma crinochetorum TaxID=295596 RepID=A0A0G7ZNJ3_9MOLU|nr:/ ribF / Riboflavin biosynthesis protein ribF /:186551 Forward [Candidatus Hepatoplasma crinochetorum]
MEIINFDIKNNKLDDKTKRIIILGKFNTFHLGHQKLLHKAIDLKAKKNYQLIVMLYPDYNNFTKLKVKKILPLEERIKILKKYNVDFVLLFEESAKNYQITRENFIDYLKKKLNVSDIIIGENFSFGKNKMDDFELLKKNFNLYLLKLEKFNNQIISSSLIKMLLDEGAIEDANKLLGFNYFYTGKVVYGMGIGKKYNTPTANVDVSETLYPPMQGIYLSKVLILNKYYYGITSISNNPTFKKRPITFETYIFNFDQDIYGKEISIELLKFMRESIKFNSIKKLFAQIEIDKIRAIELINTKK